MAMQNNNRSEVARLREQIAQEHQAAEWALTGLANGTAKHRFITRRMERIGDHQQRLASLIGEKVFALNTPLRMAQQQFEEDFRVAASKHALHRLVPPGMCPAGRHEALELAFPYPGFPSQS